MKRGIGFLACVFSLVMLPAAAQVGGTGGTNYIARWTSSSTLGTSLIFQGSNGTVGIGTTSPGARLTVFGRTGTVGVNGGNAPLVLQVSGGAGVTNNSGFGVQGAGGPLQIASGSGAPLPGSLAQGGKGAAILMTGGSGANCIPASVGCGPRIGGNGGSIALTPGAGGFGSSSSGKRGFVGVGTTTPSNTLEVVAGGSTLADHWTTRSSRRFKTNIQPLQAALEKVERLQGVSYVSKTDGSREIGVVAEDVDRVVPEVVSRDPETQEVQGVDYSRLAALLIEAVKSQEAVLRSQQSEIQQLKARIEELSRGR